MGKEEELKRVYELISRWYSKVHAFNAVEFYDINKVAEGISAFLLNKAYDYNLENLNNNKKNYPAIDLGDSKKRIAFQVTSTCEPGALKRKIKESFEKLTPDDLKIYSKAIHLFVINYNAKVTFTEEEVKKLQVYKAFNPQNIILDLTCLCKRIEKIYHKNRINFEAIKKFLEDEFSDYPEHRKSELIFKSFEPFQEKDHEIFFGRETLIDELLNAYDSINFLTVVGPSKCGKSSLIQAGIIPKLRKSGTLISFFSPNKNPSKTLDVELRETLHLNEEHMREDSFINSKEPEKEFASIINEKLKKFSAKKIVIIIDQFEEIFTRTSDEDERKNFIKLLLALIQDSTLPIKIIIVLKSEFLEKCYLYPNLSDSITKKIFQVNPLNQSQIQTIIKNSAEKLKIEIKKDLVDKLLVDTEGRQYIAPLIENVLFKLYHEKIDNKIDLKLYESDEIQKIDGALIKRIESEYQKLTEDYKEILYKMFINNLTQLDEHSILVRRRSSINELLLVSENHQAVEELLFHWIEMGFLTITWDSFRDDYFVDITYESLIQKWEKIKEWETEKKKRRKKNKKITIGVKTFIFLVFMTIIFYQLYLIQKHKTIDIIKDLSAESNFELSRNNIKALRIAEVGYKINEAQHGPHVQRALTAAAYSAIKYPFYSEKITHQDKVKSILFSPNDIQILTALIDGSLRLRHLNGNIERDFEKHKKSISSTVFSPNGTKVLTASEDKTAKLWNIEGKLIANLDKHTDWVTKAIFSPNGNKIVTISNDKTAKLWNLSGDLEANLNYHIKKVIDTKFSPDGSKILTVSEDNTCKLWNLHGDLLADLNEHKNHISNALFSKDGNKVATASWDNTAKIWDLSGNLLANVIHENYVCNVAFSPDGKKILTSSFDQTAKLWDLKGNHLKTYMHNDKVWDASFSKNGNKILTRTEKTVKLWSLDGTLLSNINHESEVKDAFFSPNGNIIISRSVKSVKLWSLQGSLLRELDRHEGEISDVVISSNGNEILTSSGNTVYRWNLKNNFVTELFKFSDNFNYALLSSGGDRILTWSGNSAQLWDKDGTLLNELKGHKAVIISAAFSADENKIVTGSWDNTMKIWDQMGNVLTDRNLDNQIVFVDSSPYNDKILSITDDYRVNLWDLNGNFIANLNKNGDQIRGAVLSPDNSQVLATLDGNSAKLMNLKGKFLVEFPHSNTVLNAIFSPNGKEILTTSSDKTAKLWDLKGKLLVTMKSHTDEVTGGIFSHDGKRILTYSIDNTAKLWDLKGNLLADLNKHTDDVLSVAFNYDDSRIITVSKDGTIKQWFTPEAIMDWLKTAPIPKLTQEEKESLGIANFNID